MGTQSAMEVFDAIEDEDAVVDKIFIAPPVVSFESDEDTGEEDCGGTFNNLSGRQLSAPAVVVLADGRVIGDDDDGDTEEEEEPQQASTSKKRSQKDALDYNWTNSKTRLTKFPDARPLAVPTILVGKSAVQKLDFFLSDVYPHLVRETIKYAAVTDSNFQLTIGELKRVVGILLLSGYHQLPSRRHYWNTDEDLHCALVAGAMSRNRFEEIIRYIHCADNTRQNSSDRMTKLRPMMDILNARFGEAYPMDCNLDLDEAMIEYFGRHGCKQAIRNKPVRFGYKAWCLNSGTNGFLLHFDIYQGASVDASEVERKFGKGGGTLLRLLDNLPDAVRALPLRIYIDNYFTGLPLVAELRRRGYACTGTIRENRIPRSCPITDQKAMKRKPRGAVSVVYDTANKIALTRWKDNAVVTIASTLAAEHPLQKVSRWSRQEKKKVAVDQPFVVQLYNRSMGGTDRADQSIELYRINMRRKKWWWPIFTWMLDAAVFNAWVLHRLDEHGGMSLLEFRREVARTLVAAPGATRARRSGRPRVCAVADDSRFDTVEHWPEVAAQGRKCALPTCKSRPSSACSKCRVALCTVKCFRAHRQPE
ncbi:piggyBac transposable element-derived protein 3-like [Syngnathus acus]|uniref:piggyBac transposable element-derived protein 3-like n=1 Tax=Syngnathus acus TaxID=161584 RepID=UPI001886256B|nr:piggyBac transposable element-derived protein 3-like [Syngnathus acus]